MFGLDVMLTLWLALGGAPNPAALARGPGVDPSGLTASPSTAGEADGDLGPGMDPDGLGTPPAAAGTTDGDIGPGMDPSG